MEQLEKGPSSLLGCLTEHSPRIWPSVVFMGIVGGEEGFRILVLGILVLCDCNFQDFKPQGFYLWGFQECGIWIVSGDSAGR